ncbi:hypothetical protein CBO05C_1924 [Clostridium botulinum B str. Osaka05]|uniref:Uncharacterized protein n=1 Tax=Clostridium botulinum B str. Osaka05 TaxID=1407017 RepID=A0A0S6U5L3_CLOBO|nr:hypothetical protein CBO05C_1924 [Clostridium botulinum B str. Osaka05]
MTKFRKNKIKMYQNDKNIKMKQKKYHFENKFNDFIGKCTFTIIYVLGILIAIKYLWDN